MNRFTESIQFSYLDNTIWTLKGLFSEEFTVGFVYGALHGLSIIVGEESYYHLDFFARRTTYSYNKRLFLMNKFSEYFVRKARINEINKRLTIQGIRNDYYSMWLIYDNDYAWLTMFRSLDFIQGLMTGLKAFNIPNTNVLLTMPIKNGIMYKIEGLILSNPNDLYKPELLVVPDEDSDKEEYYED